MRHAASLTIALVACAASADDASFPQLETTGLATHADDSSTDDTDADGSTAATPLTSEGGVDDASAGPKLDVAGDDAGPTPSAGCTKVDFLFVVDNSGSMAEEQARLVAGFPAFIAAIEASVATDFHVLVVDTDASFAIEQCDEICPANPEDTCLACAGEDEADCLALPCEDFPPPPTCDDTLGAGRRTTPGAVSCGVADDAHYLTDEQAALAETFACVAEVGTGASAERQAAAMIAAVDGASAAATCNGGFLRDDALLVVTLISDEDDVIDDDGIASAGTVAQWHDAIVAAKGGNEDAVVFLGLVSDIDLGDGVCQPSDPPVAGDAPRMRELAESFARGSWGSVCMQEYGSFFAESIEVIDVACEELEPAG